MTRNELKQMWFNLPTQTKVTKTILVEMNKNKKSLERLWLCKYHL